jgi:glucose-1-phosphate adenylyltransferase
LLAHLCAHWNGGNVGHASVVQAWRAEECAEHGNSCGTADAVYRNLASIRHSEDSLVLVLGGDHIYKMDYRPFLAAHRARNAAVTIACIRAPIEDACRLGTLAVDDDGRVERFIEKPQRFADVPSAIGGDALTSMGVYVFEAAFLARTLLLDASRAESGHDFAADILQRLIKRERVYAHPFNGTDEKPAYWRDVGTLTAYWQAHMDLLGPAPLLTLDDPDWPLGGAAMTPRIVTTATATTNGGTVEDSIVPANGTITGHVLRSVLSDGVEVGRGATLTDTVVLPGAVIGAGSRLRGVIVDAGSRVRPGTVIERCSDAAPPPVLCPHRTGMVQFVTAR